MEQRLESLEAKVKAVSIVACVALLLGILLGLFVLVAEADEGFQTWDEYQREITERDPFYQRRTWQDREWRDEIGSQLDRLEQQNLEIQRLQRREWMLREMERLRGK